MTGESQWLADRLAAAPPSLRARLEAALADLPESESLESALFERAGELLGEAIEGAADRRTAMTLLAADALVTLACERAADAV